MRSLGLDDVSRILHHRIPLGRFTLLALGVMAFFLVTFLAVSAMGLPLLVDPTPWLAGGGVGAAALAFGLLALDVFLPVPSSLVMVFDGVLFGFAGGLALNLAGALAATMLAFVLGRQGGAHVDRLLDEGEKARSRALFARWGDYALLLTRPVPILAETTALMAGSMRMSAGRVLALATLGALPPALLYAAAGALGYTSPVPLFLAFMALAALAWGLGRRLTRA